MTARKRNVRKVIGEMTSWVNHPGAGALGCRRRVGIFDRRYVPGDPNATPAPSLLEEWLALLQEAIS